MKDSFIARHVGFALLLAVLCRAVVPIGYMPGTLSSGMLFELCPDGLPAGFMTVISGGSAHHHHHHHGAGHSDEAAADAAGDRCDVGHLLLSALAVEQATPALTAIHLPVSVIGRDTAETQSTDLLAVRSRGPPA